MPRPLKHDTGPVCVVEIDERRVSWCAQEFYGDEELAQFARRAALFREKIELQRCFLTAGFLTPIEAVAAMASYCPERVIIVQAPEEVSRYIKDNQFYV